MAESRPAAKVYDLKPTAADDSEGGPGSDGLGLISIMLTITTMFSRSKLLAWVAVFFALSSIFNARSRLSDFGRVMPSLTFVIMALVTVYATPADAPGPLEQLPNLLSSWFGGSK